MLAVCAIAFLYKRNTQLQQNVVAAAKPTDTHFVNPVFDINEAPMPNQDQSPDIEEQRPTAREASRSGGARATGVTIQNPVS